MTDLLTRLSQARPTEVELDAMWAPAARGARLAMLTGPSARRGARARRTALLAAAAAVTALVVVRPVLDGGDATAADLRALARSAVRYDGPALAEGTFLHERATSVQRNSRVLGDGAVLDTERETWTAWDGRTYVVEHRPSAGWTSYDLIDNVADGVVDEPSFAFPTPEFAATMPDDADGLRAYLDSRVSGSNSHDEALFEALTGLATSHTLPPRTLAAAFEALAEVDGVRTDDVSVAGRPAVEIGWARFGVDALSLKTVVVDRATGQVLSTRDESPVSDYRSTTRLSEVVDAVPATVLAALEQYGDGGLVCDDGTTDCVR